MHSDSSALSNGDSSSMSNEDKFSLTSGQGWVLSTLKDNYKDDAKWKL